jgi:hypothetical protein
MPGSRASVFGEVEDFQAALSADSVAGLLVTGRGPFRARMTHVALDSLRLAAVEEQLARIAFVVVPAGMVLVAFPIDRGPSPVWGGIEVRSREIITLGPGQRAHARTIGPSHWGAIHVLGQQLAVYGRAVSGTRFAIPSAARCDRRLRRSGIYAAFTGPPSGWPKRARQRSQISRRRTGWSSNCSTR